MKLIQLGQTLASTGPSNLVVSAGNIPGSAAHAQWAQVNAFTLGSVIATDTVKKVGMSATVHALYVIPTKNPQLQSDEAANDSDKTITVPAGRLWHVLSVLVEYQSTGTTGNRRLIFQARDDSDDVLFTVIAGALQAASVGIDYVFHPGVVRETSAVNAQVLSPIPNDLWLKAGWDMRILDGNSVAAAADDMVVHILVDERIVGADV